MNKTSCLAVVAAAALAASSLAHAAQAAPASTGRGAHSATSFVATDRTLWNQLGTDSGVATVSQNFEDSFDQYDSLVADDFKVPRLHKWTIDGLYVKGVYFNGIGPVDSVNVTFFKDDNGLPGAVIVDYRDLAVTDDGTGSFTIALPTAANVKGGRQDGRIFWMAVQANMNFSSGGEWGWENEVETRLHGSVWENPGDGFGTGCTAWAPAQQCTGSGVGDQMFTIQGRSRKAP